MTANMACCTYVLGTPRRRGIEFEIRNDLATDPVEREKIVDVLVSAINDLHSVEFNDK